MDLDLDDTKARITVVERWAGMRLDQVLRRVAASFSREFWIRAIRAGAVHLEGRKARPSRLLVEGEQVVVDLTALGLPELTLDPGELGDFVYEDDRYLAISKPAGLLTHPAGRIVKRSAVVLASRRAGLALHTCHRLDKYTSGVLLLAKDPGSAAAASELVKAGRWRKTYLALTRFSAREDTFEVDLPLEQTGEEHVKLKMLPCPEGKPAVTRFEVRERFENGGTLLVCYPQTGRQHQIRAHLLSVGLPIVGDLLYGPEEDWAYFDDADERKHAAPDGRWHGLHAWKLVVPGLGEGGHDLELEAPLGGPMGAEVEGWRADGPRTTSGGRGRTP